MSKVSRIYYLTGVSTVIFNRDAKYMEYCFENYFSILWRKLRRKPVITRRAKFVDKHAVHDEEQEIGNMAGQEESYVNLQT
jgi:hypothetical protein